MSEYIVDFGNCMAMLYRIIESHSTRLCGQVVRCKDCAFSEIHDGNEYPIGERGSVYCLAWSDGMQGEWTKPDGFCHKGKRKEDSDD